MDITPNQNYLGTHLLKYLSFNYFKKIYFLILFLSYFSFFMYVCLNDIYLCFWSGVFLENDLYIHYGTLYFDRLYSIVLYLSQSTIIIDVIFFFWLHYWCDMTVVFFFFSLTKCDVIILSSLILLHMQLTGTKVYSKFTFQEGQTCQENKKRKHV